jgi:hypothetical protein
MLEKEQFRANRFEFITNTLQEFDELQPASLGILFDHKAQNYEEDDEDKRTFIELIMGGNSI